MLCILVGWHHPVSDGFTVQGQDPGTCQNPNGSTPSYNKQCADEGTLGSGGGIFTGVVMLGVAIGGWIVGWLV